MNTSNESTHYYSDMADILDVASASVNAFLGLPINAGILYLVFSGAAGTMASEIFTLNLSVCEILFSLFNIVIQFKKIPELMYFTYGILFTGRPVFQSCICVERFMAVVLPVLFLKYKPMRYRVGCSVFSWVVIIAVALLLAQIGLTGASYYLFVAMCILFMSVMLSCSLAVLRALKRPGPGDNKGPGPGGTGRERDRDYRMKRRAFIIICLIMVSFVGNYLFCCILTGVLAIQGKLMSVEVAYYQKICMSVTVITGFVQPLLYLCQKTGNLPCMKPIQQ